MRVGKLQGGAVENYFVATYWAPKEVYVPCCRVSAVCVRTGRRARFASRRADIKPRREEDGPCKFGRDQCLRNVGVAITISTDSGQWLIIRIPLLARDRRKQKLRLRVRRG